MASEKPAVLVTGSEGRIGRAIAARLADAYTVVGFERQCKGPNCIEAATLEQALAPRHRARHAHT